MITLTGKYTNAIIYIDDVETECIAQIVRMINHPAFTNPVRIMPDTHSGRGSVIGFSMPISDKILSQIVGVDISCGMLSFNVGKNLPISLEEVDKRVRQLIPMGSNIHSNCGKIDFAYKKAYENAIKFKMKIKSSIDPPQYDQKWFESKCDKIKCDLNRAYGAIGTLGSGNHFIELDQSLTTGDIWCTIHSGSRNFGLKICEYWEKKAERNIKEKHHNEYVKRVEEIKRTVTNPRRMGEEIQALRKELGLDPTVSGMEYLMGEDAMGYYYDMIFAQVYASQNRAKMAQEIYENALGYRKEQVTEFIETIHNYIDFEDLIIRKGAIKSYAGQKMVIPLNMRDGILLCEGKSNPDWNFSAPHGAGRAMSRSAAKRTLDMEEFKTQMDGIFSTSISLDTLDEAPGAYKDGSVIEACIEPTATVIDHWKPIYNIKASE